VSPMVRESEADHGRKHTQNAACTHSHCAEQFKQDPVTAQAGRGRKGEAVRERESTRGGSLRFLAALGEECRALSV
jgi:hypothetical protein